MQPHCQQHNDGMVHNKLQNPCFTALEQRSRGDPELWAGFWQVTTNNLERVRKVKTRHQRLYTRVQTIREELQRFLEDDEDMMKMCLTRKKEVELMAGAQPPSLPSCGHVYVSMRCSQQLLN